MRSVIVSALALFLYGCATFDTQVEPSKDMFITIGDRQIAQFKSFMVIIDPSLKTDGLAVWDWEKRTCVIYLKSYDACLKHEVRHCLEGYWHNKTPNGEDC